MGVSKVEYNNETLIDVSNDTVTPQTLAEGRTAHNSNGEQIVGEMPPEGGISEQVQADWEQSDGTAVDFIKNKPFGDNLPITERFSQAETPNPISFSNQTFGLSFYKVFDTIPTEEQVMKGASVTTNGVTELIASAEIETIGSLTQIIMPSGYMYAGFTQAGEVLIDAEYGITIDIPEIGVYIVFSYGSPLPEGLTIEYNYIGTKKIDPKYLPEPSLPESSEVIILSTDNVLDGNATLTMTDEQLEKLFEGMMNPYLNLKIYIEVILGNNPETGEDLYIYIPMRSLGFGMFESTFYLSNGSITLFNVRIIWALSDNSLVEVYNGEFIPIEATQTTSTTYGLRRPSTKQTFPSAEQIQEALAERGITLEMLRRYYPKPI